MIKPSSCIVNPFVDTEKPAPLNKDRINQALADAQKASRERLLRSKELLQEERDLINKRQEELFGK